MAEMTLRLFVVETKRPPAQCDHRHNGDQFRQKRVGGGESLAALIGDATGKLDGKVGLAVL